jgi:ribonuclease D
VAVGCEEKPPPDDSAGRELDRDLRPAVALVSAWVSQLGRDLQLDTGLLATRADLEAFLRGDASARLNHGWRHEVAGEPIRRLVSGEAALAFDRGNLVLEPRAAAPPAAAAGG